MKGSMLKRSTRKRDKGRSSPSKVLFQDPVGHALPPSLQSFRWNVDKVERKLQEKIQEKTKIAGNFVYQQAYRLLECTRGEGIDFVSFKEQLRIKFGIILDDSELQLLFDKYDEDRNGTIDLNEFIRRVLPPDYHYGRQWFELSQQESEERQAALKRESRNDFLMGMGIVRDDIDNTGETSNWTLETLMKQIQTKVVQKTPSGDDQYRRAFKMLRSGRDQGIRMRELRNNLKTKFGIFVSEKQMRELFAEFDMDGSGEIDLKEFLQFVEPPAYPGNSKVPRGLWTEEAGGGEGDEGEDEDNGEEGGETGGHADDSSTLGDDHHHHHNSRVPEDRPPSARGHRQQEETAPRHGLSGPSTSTKNVIKKERPMSANPKKQAMLKQRREQMASTSQLLEKHLRDAEAQTQALGGGHHSVTKATQTRRLTMSMADIHSLDRPATADNKRVNFQRSQPAVEEDDGTSVRSGASSASTLRPRSASSVASSRTSAASLSSSVRGASYMRRPSTPQHLRQKCLESRLAGAVAQSTGKDSPQSKQPKNAQATADRGVVKRASASGPTQIQTRAREQRRHSYSEVDYEPERDSDHDEYEAPRVARVHPKQHDPRPYSQGGRVLLRSKVSSAGCR